VWGVRIKSLQEQARFLCLGQRLHGVAKDKQSLLDLPNAVVSGKVEQRERRHSQRRDNGKIALALAGGMGRLSCKLQFAPGAGSACGISRTAAGAMRTVGRLLKGAVGCE
jgi:hypothetical protein